MEPLYLHFFTGSRKSVNDPTLRVIEEWVVDMGSMHASIMEHSPGPAASGADQVEAKSEVLMVMQEEDRRQERFLESYRDHTPASALLIL